MAATVIRYKDYELRPGAFEVPTLHGYVSSLLITRLGSDPAKGNGRMFSPRSASSSGLFETEQAAIAAAVSFGRKVIDGEVWDFTVAGL